MIDAVPDASGSAGGTSAAPVSVVANGRPASAPTAPAGMSTANTMAATAARRRPMGPPFSPASPSAAEDLVDRAAIERNHEQVSVESGFDVCDDAEVRPDQQTLTLGEVVERQVVGDPVLEPRIVDGDLVAIAGEVEPEKRAAEGFRNRDPNEQVAEELRPEGSAGHEPDAGGGENVLPAELGVAVVRAGQHEQPRERLARRVGDPLGPPPELLQVGEILVVEGRGLDALVLGDPINRAHDLDPAPVHPRLDQVQFVERVFPVLLGPEIPGHRVEGHPEAVADAVGEDLLDVGPHLAAHGRTRGEERVVGGHGAIVVEPDDHSGEVGVVGLRSAELVVRHSRPEAGQRRPGGEVLELAPTSHVADQDVELLVRTECDDAGVVIATGDLALIALTRRYGGAVLLDS